MWGDSLLGLYTAQRHVRKSNFSTVCGGFPSRALELSVSALRITACVGYPVSVELNYEYFI